MHSNVFIPSEVFLCISIGLLTVFRRQKGSARRTVYVPTYIYSPAFWVPFHSACRTAPQAKRFRTHNGSACRTVSRAEWFRTQNISAHRTVPRTERFRTQNGSVCRKIPHTERYMYSLSAVDAVFTVNCCDWNCWQRWRITQMGKVPLVLTPPFHEARGRGPKGRARAPWPPRGVKKKGGLLPFG